MSVQNKPDYKIFASGAKPGEVIPFPDVTRGWGVTLDTTGGIPPMGFFNYATKRLNEWLMYLTQRGMSEWDAAVDYPKDALIQHAGVYYVALKVSKGDQPNNSQASWKKMSDFLGVDGKLAKDQNGADIPNKPKFLENLGLGDSAHLLSDGNQIFKSGVSSEQSLGVKKGTVFIETSISGNTHPVTKLKRNTGSEIEVLWPSESGKILVHKDIEKITPKVGEFNQSSFRASELSPGWYSCNGDLYELTSPQGQALNSLSANYKTDWGIKVSNGKINMPTTRQTDGKTAILRPVNGTARLPGSVEGDAMRRLHGDFYARGIMQADGKRSSVGTAWGKSASLFSNASRSTDEQAIMLNTIADYKYEVVDRVMFDTQNAVPSSDEFRMLNMGVTLTMYLGV